jgi:transposase
MTPCVLYWTTIPPIHRKKHKKYLVTKPGRFEFVFTPKHGSWLNLIESFFGKMARQCLKGIRVNCKQELEERIYKYIEEINADPVVYHWTYKMEEVSV